MAEGLVQSLLDVVGKGVLWCSSRANRLRLRGSRIQVVGCLITRDPEPSILLGRSVYHDMWMPPQEGVNLNESFPDALRRCLEIEVGLELPNDGREFDRQFYVRSYKFMGTVPLPVARRGERPVADDAVGTALESVVLKSKSYWVAPVILKSQNDIQPTPDGKEVTEFRWLSFPMAAEMIRITNHADKANLLLRILDECRRNLEGGPSPRAWS